MESETRNSAFSRPVPSRHRSYGDAVESQFEFDHRTSPVGSRLNYLPWYPGSQIYMPASFSHGIPSWIPRYHEMNRPRVFRWKPTVYPIYEVNETVTGHAIPRPSVIYSRPGGSGTSYHNQSTDGHEGEHSLSTTEVPIPIGETVCPICQKTYARPATLKIHMRIHKGDKPYRCSYCEKCFTQSGNLSAHIRIHTGEKPFECALCPRTFRQKSALKIHINTHRKKEAKLQARNENSAL